VEATSALLVLLAGPRVLIEPGAAIAAIGFGNHPVDGRLPNPIEPIELN